MIIVLLEDFIKSLYLHWPYQRSGPSGKREPLNLPQRYHLHTLLLQYINHRAQIFHLNILIPYSIHHEAFMNREHDNQLQRVLSPRLCVSPAVLASLSLALAAR